MLVCVTVVVVVGDGDCAGARVGGSDAIWREGCNRVHPGFEGLLVCVWEGVGGVRACGMVCVCVWWGRDVDVWVFPSPTLLLLLLLLCCLPPPPAPKPTTHPQELQKVLTSMGDLGAQLGGVRQAAGAAAGISQAGAAAGAAAAAAADAVSGGASQP